MKKKKKRLLLQFFLVPVLVVFFIVFYVWGWYSPIRDDVVFTVNSGDSVTGVANRLLKNNMIMFDKLFLFSVKLNGGVVQVGTYDIAAGTGCWKLAKMLSRGNVATTNVLIPEGMTIKQIKNILNKNSDLTGDVDCFDNPYKSPACGLDDGEIFPDTYRVARGTPRLAVLDLARQKMENIKSKWVMAGRIVPAPLMGWNDVLILASIVQKETPLESEMPIVASVYLNRLRRGMRLQADPTVVYAMTDGLGDMGGQPLLRGHLKYDSPYNTYTNDGLPPGPIANVGRAAIRAVLKPADTSYLFFVADGRGGHKFSRTYEEHKKNHDDWREIKKLRN